MSFAVFVDGSANLPQSMLDGITVLPTDYIVDGESKTYTGDLDSFDAHEYYTALQNGVIVQTSLLNTQLFLTYFTPLLEQGQDVIYVSMSSGISGTFNAANIAAQELMEEFDGRTVHILDSKGCGLGSGLLALRAADLARKGTPVQEAIHILEDEVIHTCQYFIVGNLSFLKRTGRLWGGVADIGTILRINPILYGDSNGHIVPCLKVQGRQGAIRKIAQKYKNKKHEVQDQPVFISHGDCEDDALLLRDLVKEISPDIEVIICKHEPVSGSHVGPGMLALFFRGVNR